VNVLVNDTQTFQFVQLLDEVQHAERNRKFKKDQFFLFHHTLIVSTCRLTISFSKGKSSRRNVVTSPSGKALANLNIKPNIDLRFL
jgi:hypothetical protein